MDTQSLERELDRTKISVFLGGNAAFLGSLACSLEFFWDENISTAQTNGEYIRWNPSWFQKLSKEERIFIYLHELWHVARLHPIRGIGKDPETWQIACDYKVNEGLIEAGYSYGSLRPYVDPDLYKYSEEEIYELLLQGKIPKPDTDWTGGGTDEGDLVPLTKEGKHDLIAKVVRATQQAKVAKEGYGHITGNIEELINDFLNPIVPWQTVLYGFFTELTESGVSWMRPNRRFLPQGLYLPGKYTDEDKLANIFCYRDTSGSVSHQEIQRADSEIKYLKDTFNPEKITMIQFDTRITDEYVLGEEDEFEKSRIIGRGGTSLVPVKDHIEKHRPTAVIIFSDLDCKPMQPLSIDVPVIWIIINNPKADVLFGTKVHIKTTE